MPTARTSARTSGTAGQSSAVCGQCHSLVAAAAVGEFYPGGTLEDHYDRSYLEDEIDQRVRGSDGRVRMGGREYDAISNTGCFRSGEMSCLSCHAMHRGDDDLRPFSVWASDQLRPQNDSDLACLQCHEMPDVRAHTHHAKGSLGSACNDCHMPHTSYALLKAIRNHQVAPPSVAETVEAGRPNACNLCHLDRSLGWTAEQLEAWYGVEAPELGPDATSLGQIGPSALPARWGTRWTRCAPPPPPTLPSGWHWWDWLWEESCPCHRV